MSLSIRIKKGKNSQSTMTVIRKNGTKTYSKLPYNFEIHDIAHFVVEKQLKLTDSFYGLLAQGYQIQDFQLPKEERPKALWPQNIPEEAIIVEHIVNLLTIDYLHTDAKMNLSKELETILKEKKLFFDKLPDSAKIGTIQKELGQLMTKWNKLNGGEELVLELEL